MSLNIKNEETRRLAQELASLTGESMTTKVARESAALLKRKPLPDSDELLYDEKGLPK
jgi:hypothetical protein